MIMTLEIPATLQSTVSDLENRISIRAKRAAEVEAELLTLTNKRTKRENIKAINQLVYSKTAFRWTPCKGSAAGIRAEKFKELLTS